MVEGQRCSTYKGILSDVVSALLVLDHLILLGFAAAEGHATRLPRAHCHAGAVKINVHIPVLKNRSFKLGSFIIQRKL